MGFEPTVVAWKATALPLGDTRARAIVTFGGARVKQSGASLFA